MTATGPQRDGCAPVALPLPETGPVSPAGPVSPTPAAPAFARGHGAAGPDPARGDAGGPLGKGGPPKPLVIGLDLSLVSTGLACWCGLHRVKSHPSLEITRFSRLRLINLMVIHHAFGTHHGFDREQYDGPRADLVVVEDLALTRSTGQHLTRAGLWHLVMNDIDNEGIPYAIVSPTSLKKYVTGRGNAGKDEVLAAAIRRWPDAPIYGNDEADAYALQAMGLDHLGHPPAVLPAVNRAALDKVRWPITPEGDK